MKRLYCEGRGTDSREGNAHECGRSKRPALRQYVKRDLLRSKDFEVKRDLLYVKRDLLYGNRSKETCSTYKRDLLYMTYTSCYMYVYSRPCSTSARRMSSRVASRSWWDIASSSGSYSSSSLPCRQRETGAETRGDTAPRR